MKRFETRQKVLDSLEKLGLYRGKVEHPMTLPICRLFCNARVDYI